MCVRVCFNLTPNVHHTLQFIASGTKTCGFSAHCKIKWRAASVNFSHRALEPKVRIMGKWSSDPPDSSTTCLSPCTNCRFLALHLWCKTVQRRSQRLHNQGIDGVSTWLDAGDTNPSFGDTSTWHNWYICLSSFFSPFSQLGDSIGWFELFRRNSRRFDWH